VQITTVDGYHLTGTLFSASQSHQPPVLIAGGLGMHQRYYQAFAHWLAQRGHTVLTFDLRGMGASRPPGVGLRSVKADMMVWAQQDFAAALEYLCSATGSPQAVVMGHSLGSHHAAMTGPAAQSRIRKLVSVAAGAGYWRDWAAPSRNKAPLMLHLAGPLLTPVFGYFPGKRMGMVGDLPAGVMRQWSRWCRHPQFAWGAEPDKLRSVLHAARYPIHALSFTDDEAMTLDCTRKLLAATPNAPSTLETVTPASMGVPRIGHIGAFRKEMEKTLWPYIAQCLAQNKVAET
jgi:predicted alpha/beta hydrolase